MGVLDGLLDQVKDAISQHTGNQQGFDASKLLGHVTDLFSKHPANGAGNVKPASQDPYGDPANGNASRNVKPASQDPYGDPADRR